jgi:outer membrane protein
LPGLPGTADDAFVDGEQANPDLQQAKYAEQISREQVVSARAAFLPTIGLSGSAEYGATTQPFFGRTNSWNLTAAATLSEELFANGQRTSAVRQALEQNESDRILIESARRAMVQNVANAWNLMVTARTDVGLQHEQVHAAQAAYEGMQIEYDAGERTTQDVLLSEETLRNAELELLQAQRDAYVAAATVLRHIGRLRGADVVAGLPQYDAARHFRDVRNRDQVPWTGLVHGLDSLGAPGAHTHPIPAPAGAANPTSPPGAPVPAEAPLATAVPTTPAPGTTSPQPPPTTSSPH